VVASPFAQGRLSGDFYIAESTSFGAYHINTIFSHFNPYDASGYFLTQTVLLRFFLTFYALL
jgi:hypothetical protein